MRESIPKKIKDNLLDEYNHKCAVCGSDRPHIHHVNEDPSDSSINNLLPLCPNCHLSDQHNPTRKIDIPKLQLFRRYKDPVILKPQFDPIYVRQIFLKDILTSDESVDVLKNKQKSLLNLLRCCRWAIFTLID